MTDERRPEDEQASVEPALTEPTPSEPAPSEPAPQEHPVGTAHPDDLVLPREDESPEDAEGDADPEYGPDAVPPPRRRRTLTIVAGVLGVLLLAAVVALGLQVKGNHDVTAGRADALAGARQMGVSFTSVSFDNLDVDIDNVVRLATGGFQQEYSTQADAIRKVVKEQEVVSTGQVLRAGLSSWSGTKASALVIVDSTVRNKAQPGGSKIRYRLQIDLQKIDGRWLTSQIQFVL